MTAAGFPIISSESPRIASVAARSAISRAAPPLASFAANATTGAVVREKSTGTRIVFTRDVDMALRVVWRLQLHRRHKPPHLRCPRSEDWQPPQRHDHDGTGRPLHHS